MTENDCNKYMQPISKDNLHGTFHMVPFIFGKFSEPPLITVCKTKFFFRRVSVYAPGTIDVNKMLTSLSTIIQAMR